MSCPYTVSFPWLWSVWVKAPILKVKKLYIVSACLPYVNKELFDKITHDGTVLLACPEREPPTHYGKIASMIRSCEPNEVIVITIDGSPHCFTLQASVNEAEYILGKKINKKHYVVVDAKELNEISPDAIRVARYLHIVNNLIKNNDHVKEELKRHSLEYLKSIKSTPKQHHP